MGAGTLAGSGSVVAYLHLMTMGFDDSFASGFPAVGPEPAVVAAQRADVVVVD